jgi:hypothetical protein
MANVVELLHTARQKRKSNVGLPLLLGTWIDIDFTVYRTTNQRRRFCFGPEDAPRPGELPNHDTLVSGSRRGPVFNYLLYEISVRAVTVVWE